MAVLYRRNRDYSKQFECTYELNEELNKYYKKSKEDPRIGCMKSMKKFWDEIHPELAFFTSKNPRDQANRIEKRKITMETQPNQHRN